MPTPWPISGQEFAINAKSAVDVTVLDGVLTVLDRVGRGDPAAAEDALCSPSPGVVVVFLFDIRLLNVRGALLPPRSSGGHRVRSDRLGRDSERTSIQSCGGEGASGAG